MEEPQAGPTPVEPEIPPEEAPPPPEPKPTPPPATLGPGPAPTPSPAPKVAEKRKVGRLRGAFRWLMVLLIFFALGALVVTIFFYIPALKTMDQNRSALQAADIKAGELQTQMDTAASQQTQLETKTKDLQAQLDQANLQILVLSAQNDAASAQIAVSRDDMNKARSALSKTPATLDKLAALLPDSQKPLVADMQARLKLVVDELDKNKYSAQSDLDVLLTGLLELENSLLR